MKTHIRMIIASAIVIALALTAVSGITYSWFSDTESTNISVTTATMDLKVVANTEKTYNFGEIDGTEVTFTNSLGNALVGSDVNPYSITVENLCAKAYVSIPYSIQYKSDINTVARVTATISVTYGTDHFTLLQALSEITLGFNGTSKMLTKFMIGHSTVTNGDGTITANNTVDLLPWTVNEATTGDDVATDAEGYADLLTNNNLTIGTTDKFNRSGLTFTITLKSEIYQKSYVYTSYTHEYTYNATFDDVGTLTIGEVYDIPANRLVSFDKVVYRVTPSSDEEGGSGEDSSGASGSSSESTIDYTFTNVLLDFTKCTGFDYFTMIFDYSSAGAEIEIIPLEYVDDECTLMDGVTENVTISLNCEGSLADLTIKETDTGDGSTADIILNRSADDGSFAIINVPIGVLRILDADYIN